MLGQFVGYLVFVEGFYYGVEFAGEVFHGSSPGGSAGFSLTNIGSLNAAGGAGEVTLGAPRWVVRCWVLVPMTSPAVPVPVRPPGPTPA